jgi:16S rRNA (cytosine1402-N4)-methyltransferase
MEPKHYSVMVNEVLEYLAVRPDGTYIDATCGLGGHVEAIARKLTTGKVIANDRDLESLEHARKRLEPLKERVLFHHGRFSELPSAMAEAGCERVDGILADVGVSLYQLTSPERAFSFSSEEPLDMRMDRSQGKTAADLINHVAERELADILFFIGEERRARKLARAVVRARPIRSASHLASVIEAVSPPLRTLRLHPATRAFMALRIVVNQELEELDSLLEQLPNLLASGGRSVFLAFHSLEDRRVKQRFRALAREGLATLLTKRVVRPAEEETQENPPSRSAKMRALEMQ